MENSNERKNSFYSALALIFGIVAFLFSMFSLFKIAYIICTLMSVGAFIMGIIACIRKSKLGMPITGIVFAVVSIIIGTIFINSTNKKFVSTKKNINDQALEYMEWKYGEKFTYCQPTGNSLSGNHDLIVNCESTGDSEIFVRVENYRKDNKVFRDNYLAVKNKDDITNFVKSIVSKEFKDCIVEYTPSDYCLINLKANASIEQIIQDSEGEFYFIIYVNENELKNKEQANKILENIDKSFKGYHLYVRIEIIDKNIYEKHNTNKNIDITYGTIATVTLDRKDGKREIDNKWYESPDKPTIKMVDNVSRY